MDDIKFLLAELDNEFRFCKKIGILTADLIKLNDGLQSLVTQLVGDLPPKITSFVVSVVNTVTLYTHEVVRKRRMAENN